MARLKFLSAHLATSVLCGALASTALVVAPIVAHADATSSLTGLKMPRGAEKFDGITGPYVALLTTLSKEKPVSREIADAPTEVFIWKGASYREDKVAFTKGALVNALEAAGYTVQEISRDDLREVNVFSNFPDDAEELPFKPAVWKPQTYLLAQSNTKKKAFLGAWLESGDALTLGLLPVEFKAPRGPVQWPPLGANAVLVKNSLQVAASLPPLKNPTFAALSPKPGTARGWLKDGSGRPVANAEVVVESSMGGGLRTHHKSRSNAQGLYQVLVPTGIARVVSVEVPKVFNGEKFNLPLSPARGETRQFNSSAGGVENFVLRMTGEQGGVIRLTNNLPEKSEVEVTLVPQGPLMDGSTGKTLVHHFVSSPYDEKYLVGVPLGRYKVSVRVNDEGDIVPVRVAKAFGSDEDRAYRPSLIMDFKSGYTYHSTIQSNRDVQHFQILISP